MQFKKKIIYAPGASIVNSLVIYLFSTFIKVQVSSTQYNQLTSLFKIILFCAVDTHISMERDSFFRELQPLEREKTYQVIKSVPLPVQDLLHLCIFISVLFKLFFNRSKGTSSAELGKQKHGWVDLTRILPLTLCLPLQVLY